PLETSNEPESTAAATRRSILGISFSAPAAYRLPPGSMKSACASTSQKTLVFAGIETGEMPAALFYRKAADALADLFKGTLERHAEMNGIFGAALDLEYARRKMGEAVRTAIAQEADGFRRRDAL